MKKILLIMVIAFVALFTFTSCYTTAAVATVKYVKGLKAKVFDREYIYYEPDVIGITQLFISDTDSVGGNDITIGYNNLSDKTIKYAYFTVSLINAVGDPLKDEITNRETATLKDTGPYYPLSRKGEKTLGGIWDTVIYSWGAKSVRLESIHIEYMDGTEYNLKNPVKGDYKVQVDRTAIPTPL